MKHVFRWIIAGLILLVVVLVGNTWRFQPEEVKIPSDKLPEISAADSLKMVERFSRALQFPTISRDDARRDTAAFRAFLTFLSTRFPGVFSTLHVQSVNRWSLILHWPGAEASQKPLLFLAHYDVVPVDSATLGAWRQPPFSGAIADGFIWGRGAIDDKAGTMITLEALEYLIGRGFRPQRSIYVAIGHDEEIGGLEGARHMARLFQEQGLEFELVLDEGGTILKDGIAGINRPVAMVGIAEKGYVTLCLTARGTPGHSSMPPRHTAIGRLAAAIQRLENHPLPAAITGPTRAFFDAVGRHMPFLPRLIIANRWLFSPLLIRQLEKQPATNALVRTTSAVTVIHGGVKSNILPAKATALVNFRIRPGESVEQVIEHVRKVIDDPSIHIDIYGKLAINPSPVSPIDGEAFRRVSHSIRRIFPGTLVAPYTVLGATDSRYYYSVSRAVYRFLPLQFRNDDLPRIHGINERISTRNLINGVRFIIDLIQQFN
ncbi:MAG: M20/M25/M40 family metallo-hydrolase [Calditrichaeota bacterium]|nr:M20/M25/M40 family metallo-hydrolase [Calditrichota bacterium]